MRLNIALWLPVALVVFQGCVIQVPSQPAEQVLARLDIIAVVSANSSPEVDAPAAIGKAASTTKGALKGLARGVPMAALCPLAIPMLRYGGDPAVLLTCLGGAGTPLWVAAGAAEGAKAWIPEQVETEGQALLRRAIQRRRLPGTLRDHVVDEGAKLGRHEFVAVDKPHPGGDVGGQETDYRRFAGPGVDAVLEVHLAGIGFTKDQNVPEKAENAEKAEGEEYKTMPFSLTMSARARLIRTRDNKPLAEATYTFTSRNHEWSRWAAAPEDCNAGKHCKVDAGPVFGQAIEDGRRILAQRIIDEFFSVSSSPADTAQPSIHWIPYLSFDSKIVDGTPQVHVRLATREEVPAEQETTLREALSVPLVRRTLKTHDIAKKVQQAVRTQLTKPFGKAPPNDHQLEVVIQRYGFDFGPRIGPDKHRTVCLVMNAYFEFRVSNKVIFRDRVFWEPYKRSKDLPPPQCVPTSEVAAQDAKPIFDEAAEVLGAAIVGRFQ